MGQKHYKTLFDAIKDNESDDDNAFIDIVTLPPESVDEITDTEDNYSSLMPEITDLENIPEVCGEVEVFAQNDNFCESNVDTPYNSWISLPFDLEVNNLIGKKENFIPLINEDQFKDLSKNYQSPYELFSHFFDNHLLTYIVKQTNLYSQQKNNHKFHLTVCELKSFLGILILSGYNRLPRQHMYWQAAIDSGVEIVKKTMSYKRFKEIKKFIHFNNIMKIDRTDKAFKIRPLRNFLNKNFKKFGVNDNNISIDEQMVPYTGRHSIKMYMKSKPVRFGFKQWVMASSSGYVYSFDLYLGRSESYDKDLGLGGSVVTNFVKELKSNHETNVYFDNFFTSLKLLEKLDSLGIKGTGTARQNRLSKCPITQPKTFQKCSRGTFESFQHGATGILCTQWNDTKPVVVMSNCFGVHPLQRVNRYCKEKKGHSMINQPYALHMYNKYMGGVDLVDNAISCYRINIRSKKWYWQLFTNMISMAINNSWKLSNQINSRSVDILEHTRQIVLEMITPMAKIKTGRRSTISRAQVSKTCHFPCIVSHSEKIRRRCIICKNSTIYYWKNCKCHMHIKCSEVFHQ